MFCPRTRAYVGPLAMTDGCHINELIVGDGDGLSDSNRNQMGAQVHYSHCVSFILLDDGHAARIEGEGPLVSCGVRRMVG